MQVECTLSGAMAQQCWPTIYCSVCFLRSQSLVCLLVIVVVVGVWYTLGKIHWIYVFGRLCLDCVEVVDVPFTLRVRCELFVLDARLVGRALPLLDFVAVPLSAAAAAAVAATAAAAAGVRMSDEMA